MQTIRLWAIGATILMAAIIALGWLLGISPKLSEAAASAEQAESVEANNVTQEAVLEGLKKDFSEIEERRAELKALQVQIPEGDSLAEFIGEMHDLEQASGTVLTNFTAGDGVGFVPAAADPAAPAPAEASAPVEPTAVDPDDPAAVAAALKSKIAAEAATLSPAQFIVIEVTVQVTGSQAQVLDFVNRVQHGDGRLFLITQLTVEGDQTDGAVYNGTITGNVYVLLNPADVPVDAAPAATTDEDTATP